jgi:hypothetical protein
MWWIAGPGAHEQWQNVLVLNHLGERHLVVLYGQSVRLLSQEESKDSKCSQELRAPGV